MKCENILSALRSIPRGEDLPSLDPPDSYSLNLNDVKDFSSMQLIWGCRSADPPYASPEPHLISQSELNDLVRDLE